jgi:hypothetical protein
MDNYLWAHAPARLHLKGMCAICWQIGIYPHCRELDAEIIQKLISGTVFPHALLQITRGRPWHLDDYIFTDCESVVAKDTEEALEVRAMLEEQKLLHRLPKPL